MGKNDFVIQNNLLRLFTYAETKEKSLSSYFKNLVRANEMDNLLSGYPYREDDLQKLIDHFGRKGPKHGYEFYLYFAHCLIYLRQTTLLPCPRFDEWADPDELSSRFDFYHTHSDEAAFEEMCFARLRRRQGKRYPYSLFQYCLALTPEQRRAVGEKIFRFYFPFRFMKDHGDYFDPLTQSIGYLYSNDKTLLFLDANALSKLKEPRAFPSFLLALATPTNRSGFFISQNETVFVTPEGEKISFAIAFREIRSFSKNI